MVNLGRKWVEAEDEGTSSCEQLRVVLAVLLVVAVCQNISFENKIAANMQNTGTDSEQIQTPRSVGRPGF